MKKNKGKIRKEIKYSTEEWNKVVELAIKSGKLPAAYIRDKALNTKILIYNDFAPDIVPGMRNKFHREINDVAKTVNTNKEVLAKDVEELESIINEMGEFAHSGLRTIPMREVRF